MYLLLITVVTFGIFCSKGSEDKLEQLIKQALRVVLKSNLDYETLLKMVGSVNLESPRVQNILDTTYKTHYGIAPLSIGISDRVWLIVAGRGSKVAVAGPMSRSRVQSRGRGPKVAVAGPMSRQGKMIWSSRYLSENE